MLLSEFLPPLLNFFICFGKDKKNKQTNKKKTKQTFLAADLREN